MINRVALLLAPTESAFSPVSGYHIPPLALAVLTGYLRRRGLEVLQNDLNWVFKRQFASTDREAFSFVYDKERVLAYLGGKMDRAVDQILERAAAGLGLDRCQIAGLSIGADFSWMQIHVGLMLGRYIQQRYGFPVVLGGNNVDYLYIFREAFSELWEKMGENFAYIVRGPGEQSLYQLIEALNRDSGPEEIYNIDGMITFADRKPHARKEALPAVLRPDFDGLNLQAYHTYFRKATGNESIDGENLRRDTTNVFRYPPNLLNMQNTIRRHRQNGNYEAKLILPYIFNYHCPFNCAFCSQSAEGKKKVIIGQVEQVIEDIVYLMERYDTRYFFFLNNAINASPTFVDRFCDAVAERDLEFCWADCARFNNMTRERLARLYKAGCRKLVFGFETGSPRLLELIDKRIDLHHAELVLRWCHEVGIMADLEVIVGLPQETEEDFQATYDFCLRNRKYWNYLAINRYFLVPDSRIGVDPERYGIELVKDVVIYDTILAENSRWFFFANDVTPPPQNFKIYLFNEKGGKNHEQVSATSRQRQYRMHSLQNRVFGEKFIKMIELLKALNVGARL